MTNYNNGYNNQGDQGPRRNSGFDNLADITIVGRITKDPESKVVNNSKVASTSVAVNHRSERAGTDYWFVEVWGNEGQDSKHNFFVNHCGKGRRVLIKGTPELRRQQNQDGSYNYFPTIRATEVLGLDGGNGQQQGGQQNQQYNNQQPPTGQFGGQQQGGFPPQQGGYGQPQGGGYGQPQGQPQQGQPPQQGGQPQQGGFPPPPPQQQQQGGFPPNPPGGGFAPAGVGAPNGGFPR